MVADKRAIIAWHFDLQTLETAGGLPTAC